MKWLFRLFWNNDFGSFDDSVFNPIGSNELRRILEPEKIQDNI